MNPELAAWLNRIGVLLEFFSFWLVAPEFLGEERLKRMEAWMERGLAVLPSLPVALVLLVWFLLLTGPLPLLVFPGAAQRFMDWVDTLPLGMAGYMVLVLVAMAVLLPIAVATTSALERALTPLLHSLARDEQIRVRVLWLGVMILTIGTFLQFIATFARNS
jgi:hypothetical protein